MILAATQALGDLENLELNRAIATMAAATVASAMVSAAMAWAGHPNPSDGGKRSGRHKKT